MPLVETGTAALVMQASCTENGSPGGVRSFLGTAFPLSGRFQAFCFFSGRHFRIPRNFCTWISSPYPSLQHSEVVLVHLLRHLRTTTRTFFTLSTNAFDVQILLLFSSQLFLLSIHFN